MIKKIFFTLTLAVVLSGCVTRQYAELRYLEGKLQVYRESDDIFRKLQYCEPVPTPTPPPYDNYIKLEPVYMPLIMKSTSDDWFSHGIDPGFQPK